MAHYCSLDSDGNIKGIVEGGDGPTGFLCSRDLPAGRTQIRAHGGNGPAKRGYPFKFSGHAQIYVVTRSRLYKAETDSGFWDFYPALVEAVGLAETITFPDHIPLGTTFLTKAAYEEVHSQKLTRRGSGQRKWKPDGNGGVTKNADPRPDARFKTTDIDVDVGTPDVSVDIEVHKDGVIDTSYGETITAYFEGHPYKLEFSSGLVSLPIDTSISGSIIIVHTNTLRLTNTLTVVVRPTGGLRMR